LNNSTLVHSFTIIISTEQKLQQNNVADEVSSLWNISLCLHFRVKQAQKSISLEEFSWVYPQVGSQDIKALQPFTTSVTIYQSTQYKSPEDLNLQEHCCNKCKSLVFMTNMNPTLYLLHPLPCIVSLGYLKIKLWSNFKLLYTHIT